MFSSPREESNKLIKIIKSRVVDCHTTEDVENQRQTELPNRTVGGELTIPSDLYTSSPVVD